MLTFTSVMGRFVIALGALLLAASPARADDPAPFVPGEVVVRLRLTADPHMFAAQYGSAILDSITSRNIHRLSVPPLLTEEEFLDLIDDDGRVLDVELNFIGDDINPDGSTQSIFILSFYKQFINQDAIDRIGSDLAHTKARGHGVLVVVIDSGIDPDHPLFAGRLPFGGIDLLGAGAPLDTGDGMDNDGDGLVDEMTGHGTLVAGIILRVAPEALLLPIRVLDSDGGSTTFRMIDAIYIASDLGADVINVSLGTVAPSTLLAQAVDHAADADTLVVCAAGNDAQTEVIRYPAGFSGGGVLAIAATDDADFVAPFSNIGDAVTLCAPGDPMVGPVPGGGYGRARGSSFAAPVISGVAALVRSIAPAVPIGQTRQRLLTTAVSIDDINPDEAGDLGAGRVDAAAAVGALGDPLANSADLNGDARVDIRDLYAFNAFPVDINGDGAVTSADRAALRFFIRRFESRIMAGSP